MYLCNGSKHLFGQKDADSNERFYIGIHVGITFTYFASHFAIHKTNRSSASMQKKYN